MTRRNKWLQTGGKALCATKQSVQQASQTWAAIRHLSLGLANFKWPFKKAHGSQSPYLCLPKRLFGCMFQRQIRSDTPIFSKALSSSYWDVSHIFLWSGRKDFGWGFRCNSDIPQWGKAKASGLTSCFSTPVSRNSGERIGSPTRCKTSPLPGKFWNMNAGLWSRERQREKEDQG